MDEQCVALCREQQDDISRGRVQQVVEVEPHSMYGGKSELETAGGEKHEGESTDSVEESILSRLGSSAHSHLRVRTKGCPTFVC
jgi:hypothetical protein